MVSSTLQKSRKKSAVGIAIGAAAIVALVAGIVLTSGSASAADNLPPDDSLIPTGPITQAEIDACELVLAMDPEPTSYTDDQGRVWTPCVEWWLGIDIPNWPSGMWPGQVPYLHTPADTAEWLGCIAGYLVYKGPLAAAASETFTDEAVTVDITKKLSARRTILRAYVSKRLAELGRQNLATKCQPNIKPLPLPKPNPQLPPNPDDLSFDLKGNWGGIPEDLRPWLAKLELASGIPGIARAAGVRWWESFRAGKPVVSTAEAKAIAAANPELARFFVNKNDGKKAKEAIDEDIAKQGWPMPVDYDGWIEGSFGLGDILGSTFVYSGIHTEGKKAGPSGLPFVFVKSAKAAYESYEGQCAALAYIVYRVLYGDLKVLVPGIQAAPEKQNPKQSWINIFAAYAYPASYKAKTQLALTAAANYEKRAAEIGVNLEKVAFPWPPGMSYKTWDFGDFWARLVLYSNRTVKHLPGVYDENMDAEQQGFVVQTKAQKQFALQGNVQASIASNIPDGASAPLVVFLHDRDADESQLAGLVLADQVNARLVYLRAPNKGDVGYRWFNADLTNQDPNLANQLEAATNIVSTAGQQLVKLYPGTSQIYVVGFGQGAAIAYRLAARGEVAKVLSIAGMLPTSLRLADAATTKTATVLGVHGQDDKIVSPADDAATIESFIFKSDAKLNVVPGATHTLQSLHDAIGLGLVEMLT